MSLQTKRAYLRLYLKNRRKIKFMKQRVKTKCHCPPNLNLMWNSLNLGWYILIKERRGVDKMGVICRRGLFVWGGFLPEGGFGQRGFCPEGDLGLWQNPLRGTKSPSGQNPPPAKPPLQPKPLSDKNPLPAKLLFVGGGFLSERGFGQRGIFAGGGFWPEGCVCRRGVLVRRGFGLEGDFVLFPVVGRYIVLDKYQVNISNEKKNCSNIIFLIVVCNLFLKKYWNTNHKK